MDLVLGSSGFIGTHVVAELRRGGRTVRGYDVRSAAADRAAAPDEHRTGDILDEAALRAAMDGCEVVYHLAGNPNLWARDRRAFDRVNHQGTLTVLRAARAAGVARLVYTGTESILAPRRPAGLITENAQPRLADMIGPYCRSKFRAEQAVLKAAADGLPAVVAAPTMPIGPGDWNRTPPTRMIEDFLRGRIPGTIGGVLNFVDVRDVAIGHVRAAETGRVNTRYILAGTNATLADFFGLLGRLTGRPPPRWRIPYLAALAFSHLEEGVAAVTGRPPQSSVTGVRLCRRHLAFDGSFTWNQLGHAPRPLEESLRDAVTWLHEFGVSPKMKD